MAKAQQAQQQLTSEHVSSTLATIAANPSQRAGVATQLQTDFLGKLPKLFKVSAHERDELTLLAKDNPVRLLATFVSEALKEGIAPTVTITTASQTVPNLPAPRPRKTWHVKGEVHGPGFGGSIDIGSGALVVQGGDPPVSVKSDPQI